MEYSKLNGLDKAGILFQVLGEGLALSIFKDIKDSDLRKIRVRSRELTSIPFKLKKAVLEEFYFGFITDKFKETSEESRKPFSFLEKLSDEQIHYLLVSEPPRIIAITLAQMDAERQMRVFDRMDVDIRTEILMEMGSADNMNLEAVVTVASDLKEKSRYLPKATEFERGGGEKLAAMLSQMDPDQAELFLNKLGQEDPEKLKEVKRYYMTFDDIFLLPDAILRDLMNSVELDDIAMAVKGVDEETIERILNNLPQKKQAMFEPVEVPVPKREIGKARKKILEQARKFEDEGRFNMADLLGGEMVE